MGLRGYTVLFQVKFGWMQHSFIPGTNQITQKQYTYKDDHQGHGKALETNECL